MNSLIVIVVLLNLKNIVLDVDTKLSNSIMLPEKYDEADQASERIPPGTVLGLTNNNGKQVGALDFIDWVYSKIHH